RGLLMPRPLSSFHPPTGSAIGNTGGGLDTLMPSSGLFICNSHSYPLEIRPTFLPLAMRVISACSILDSYVGRTLAAIVGGSTDVALAMYNALGSVATQHAALRGAARTVLSPDHMLLLEE